MNYLSNQLGKVNAWLDCKGETVRLIIFTLLITMGSLALTIGVNTKSRWLLLLGVLSFIPVVATAGQRAFVLGYKNTMHVVALFLAFIIIAALILSIF